MWLFFIFCLNLRKCWLLVIVLVCCLVVVFFMLLIVCKLIWKVLGWLWLGFGLKRKWYEYVSVGIVGY